MRGNKILLGTNISENQIKSSIDLAGWGMVSNIFQIILVFNLIYYTVTHIAHSSIDVKGQRYPAARLSKEELDQRVD